MRFSHPILLSFLAVSSSFANAQITNDSASTNPGVPVKINVTANDNVLFLDENSVDIDVDTDGIQTSADTPEGSYTVDDGDVTFSPEPSFAGVAKRMYSVNYGLIIVNTGSAEITVRVNGPPSAADDEGETTETKELTINLIANDTDTDGTIAANTVDLNPATPALDQSFNDATGSFVANNAGALVYTPAAGYNGVFSLTYTVQDNEGATSNVATVTITVASNAAPTAVNDATSTNEGSPVTINVVSNDTDSDGTINASTVDLDPATTGIQTSATTANGNFTVNNAGEVSFTPAAGVTGNAVVSYTVNDNLGATSNVATLTITVNASNVAPVANNDATSTTAGSSVTINVISNDTDSDGTINASTVDLDPATAGIQPSMPTAAGNFTVNNAGVVSFTPLSGFTGAAVVSYTVNDNVGATSNVATLTITVNAANVAPVANNDATSANEGATVTFNVVSNDTDSDGTVNASTVDLNPATTGIQTSAATVAGNFTVNNTGVVSFTPLTGFTGSAVISYTVNDNLGATSNIATLTITVNESNNAPVANNDATSTNEGVAVTFNIVSNDTDDESVNAASVDLNPGTTGRQETLSTAAGNFAVNSTGDLTYTPALNFSGTASISYTVNDNDGVTSNTATITIAVNDKPVARNDDASTSEGNAVNFNVVANDTDDVSVNAATVDLDPSNGGIQNTITITAGTFTVNALGLVTFTPTNSFSGEASISYTVNDNQGATSNPATIKVTVSAVNIPPVANNDPTNTDEDVAKSFNIISNDNDSDGSLMPNTVDLDPAVSSRQTTKTVTLGTFTIDDSGMVTFTPKSNANGTASIMYTVRDNEGAASNTASVSVVIDPVNDKPIANHDARTIAEDTQNAIVDVLANDTDPENNIDKGSVDLNPGQGGVQKSITTPEGEFSEGDLGKIAFQPNNNFFGTASITYTVMDQSGLTSDAANLTITVTSVNDAPIANNDIISTNQGVTQTWNVVANDIDVDGSVVVSSVDLNPAASGTQTTLTISGVGVFSVNGSGVVTFDPADAFSGTASVEYTIKDNAGATSNKATFSVLVNSVNTNPVAVDDAATTNEEQNVTVNILANDKDDGSINTASVDINPNIQGGQKSIVVPAGTFSENGSGMVTFDPASNFSGTVSITYTVNDNIGATSNAARITITVNDLNDSPTAVADNASGNEGTAVTVNVVSNDTDADGSVDVASVALGSTINPAGAGAFSVNASGVVTFTPAENFFGQVTTTYTVKDQAGATSTPGTITINIANVNDPPSFKTIADMRLLRNAAKKTFTIENISAGPGETEQRIVTVTSGNTTLIPQPVVSYNGTASTATVSFQPQANQVGVAEMTAKVVDTGTGLLEFSQTFRIEVVDLRITTQPVTVAIEGEPYEYAIETTDVLETLTIVAPQKPTWATLSANGKNKAILKGTPPASASGSSPVKIQVKDGSAILDEQSFTIVVNHRPTITSFALTTTEDVPVTLEAQKFADVYKDEDGHSLAEVEFTALPRHGSLQLNEVAIAAGEKIPFASLSNVRYQPQNNYSGLDTIHWKASDGLSYSKETAYVDFTIQAVNDAPRIVSLETDTLQYEVGTEVAQLFTTIFDAEDAEGDSIVSAEVGIRIQNYVPEKDILGFTNTTHISGVFNSQIGILTLTGKAPVEEYEEFIRGITYNHINLTSLTSNLRSIYITLSDGKASSETKERMVALVYRFISLDIPTGFTPNGDRINDTWRLSTPGIEQFSDARVRVFTRRGQVVFETQGFETEWDGTMNGQELPVDSYYYTIDLKYNKIQYKGVVTILR